MAIPDVLSSVRKKAVERAANMLLPLPVRTAVNAARMVLPDRTERQIRDSVTAVARTAAPSVRQAVPSVARDLVRTVSPVAGAAMNPVTQRVLRAEARVVSPLYRSEAAAQQEQRSRLLSEGKRFQAAAVPFTRPARFVTNFARDSARAFPRGITSFVLDVAAPVTSLATGRNIAPVYTPRNRFERTIFGDQPVYGFSQHGVRTARDLYKGEDPAKKFLAGAAGIPLAVAGSVFDLTLIGGSEKAGVEQVGKGLLKRYGDNAAETIAGILRGDENIIKSAAPEVVDDVMKTLARSGSKAEDVAQAVDRTVQATRRPLQEGERVSSLVKNIAKSPSFDTRVAEEISGVYKTINNAETIDRAAKRVAANLDLAKTELAAQKTAFSADDVAASKLVVEKLLKEKRFTEAVSFIDQVTKQATELGQAVQAFSIWGKLTPEGALKYTASQIEQANASMRALGLKGDVPKLSEEAAKAINSQAGEVQKLVRQGLEGTREHVVAVSKLQSLILAQLPVSTGQKISSLQTMAQLLSPVTATRNIVGNTLFAAQENVSQAVAAGLSRIAEPFTGARSVGAPHLPTQARGGARGFGEAVSDIKQGINTRGFDSKFELRRNSVWQKFDPKTGELSANSALAKLERVLRYELEAFDRAAFTAAYDDTVREIRQLVTVNGIEMTPKVEEKIADAATYEGIYRTFQDDSMIAGAMSRMKRLLNQPPLGTGDFGLGDFLLKYPKTPGNILSRGLEYSPAAFVDLTFDLLSPYIPFLPQNLKNYGRGQLAKQLGGSLENVPEEFIRLMNHRRIIKKGSRALVGSSSLTGSGALLHRLGIITGKNTTTDQDQESFDKMTGFKDYRINTSALKRFIFSGLNPKEAQAKDGDLMVSYDWLQPMAIGVSIGASLDAGLTSKDKNFLSLLTNVASGSVMQSLEAVVDQPSFKGIGDLVDAMKYTPEGVTPLENVLTTLFAGIPASFIPSVLGRLASVVDPSARDIVGETTLKTGINKTLNKIPFARSVLPQQYDSFGQPIKYNQASILSKDKKASFLERSAQTLFSPAFLERVKLTPEAELVLDVYKNTGESETFPRLVSRSQQVGSTRFKLTPDQKNEMQKVVGTATQNAFKAMAKDPRFISLPEEEKAKIMSDTLSDIYSTYKYVPYMEYLGVEIPKGVRPPDVKRAYDVVSRDDRFKTATDEQKRNEFRKYFDSLQ